MRRLRTAEALTIVGVLATVAWARPSAAPGQTPGANVPAEAAQDFNDRTVDQLRRRIAGRGAEPASEVFRNIQLEWFKDVPADRLLAIMNGGYSKALGVRCTHCHLEDDFSSDDLRPKRAAREMAVMHKGLNEQLGRMKNLEGSPDDRFINCATCHRGKVDPRDSGSN